MPDNTAVFIPSHLASSRLPRKALVDIEGLPMIVHVARRCALADVGPVYVATDSDEIAAVLAEEPVEVVMTSSDHQTGTDRIGEAIRGVEADYVVNVQGDEALVKPRHIRAIDELLRSDSKPECALLTVRLSGLTASDIKVVTDLRGRVLYLSRADIPFSREGAQDTYSKAYHVVGFQRSFLETYCSLERTPLELTEYNEYLRILEHGYTIQTREVDAGAVSVDTQADLDKVRRLMSEDEIAPLYRNTGGRGVRGGPPE